MHIRTLVETGTFYGDMIEAVRGHFDTIVSIELSPRLHALALRRFAGAVDVRLVLGDSSIELPHVLEGLSTPAIFWLDGHYSGNGTARGDEDTPIRRELAAIVCHPVEEHLVLVDDARLFGSDRAYPCIAEMERLVRVSRPGWVVVVSEDILRIGSPERVGL
ncbi:MAG: hypothetical protein IPL90_15370 [Holophagales bacterium]|nr:hypothetical protein [Holophagales bacterium]